LDPDPDQQRAIILKCGSGYKARRPINYGSTGSGSTTLLKSFLKIINNILSKQTTMKKAVDYKLVYFCTLQLNPFCFCKIKKVYFE
jgi:hypothetical protein